MENLIIVPSRAWSKKAAASTPSKRRLPRALHHVPHQVYKHFAEELMAFARDAITGFFADPREGKEIDYRGELEFDGYWYDFRFAGTVYFSEWDAPDGILLKIIDMLDTWIEMASTPKDGDEVPNDFEIRYFNALIKSYL